jgi:DNA invertase Pin-like site-specific DNA recombinase
MTINLFALGNRATAITTIAVLGVVAMLVAPSTPARAADGRPTPVLGEGAGMGIHPSAHVRVVQRALQRRGYDLGPPGVDGRFGPLTNAAVRHMQADYRLTVDGIVGRETRKALRVTRRAASQTQPRRHAGHGPSAPQPETSTQVPTAPATTPRGAAVELHSRDVDWSRSLLAGALGGAITFLFAMVVRATGRRRHRPDASRSGPWPPVAERTASGNGGEPAGRHTMRLVRDDVARAVMSASAATVEPPRECLAPGHRVIGYVTVSSDTGIGDGDGSSAAIRAMCDRSGWELVEIVRDRDVGPTLERPALGYALQRIAHGQADGLVVSDMQRLSRSIVDLGALMAWFRNARAALIALDLDIDTSTPRGRRVASTLITLSDHAQRRIAHRTRIGLAELGGNRRPGRPAVQQDPELLERIAAMRAGGMTLQAIADELNVEGVPTLRGGRMWRPSSIQAALGYRRPGPRAHLPSLEHTKAGP